MSTKVITIFELTDRKNEINSQIHELNEELELIKTQIRIRNECSHRNIIHYKKQDQLGRWNIEWFECIDCHQNVSQTTYIYNLRLYGKQDHIIYSI